MNDYSYRENPAHQNDSRWVHRPKVDWAKYSLRADTSTTEGRVYQGLQSLIKLRKESDAFASSQLKVIQTGNEHVLGFMRQNLVILANFSERHQIIPILTMEGFTARNFERLHGISEITKEKDLTLEPLDFLVIKHQV